MRGKEGEEREIKWKEKKRGEGKGIREYYMKKQGQNLRKKKEKEREYGSKLLQSNIFKQDKKKIFSEKSFDENQIRKKKKKTDERQRKKKKYIYIYINKKNILM